MKYHPHNPHRLPLYVGRVVTVLLAVATLLLVVATVWLEARVRLGITAVGVAVAALTVGGFTIEQHERADAWQGDAEDPSNSGF